MTAPGGTYPVWTWADRNAMRVEVEHDRFVDYVRANGVWRQKTPPMTATESVTPERHWLEDWRSGPACWPVVHDEFASWLESTYEALPAVNR